MLPFSQNHKSLKIPFGIYANTDSFLEKYERVITIHIDVHIKNKQT